jgi:hypothetical protein
MTASCRQACYDKGPSACPNRTLQTLCRLMHWSHKQEHSSSVHSGFAGISYTTFHKAPIVV